MNLDTTKRPTITEIFDAVTPLHNAIKEAVREAILDHKRAGNPIASWQDGKVVWIPADEIKVPEPAESKEQSAA